MFTTNIMHVFLNATADDIHAGMHWYDEAHNLAAVLSPGDVWRGAGVISAYSPLTPWWRNKELAIDSLTSGVARPDSLGNSVRAAQRILDGEPVMEVLRGDKTRAFAYAIAEPENASIATIDCHAHDIAMGKVFPGKGRKIGKRLYRDMAEAYSDCADMTGFSTAQIQAITWVAWRNWRGGRRANSFNSGI